MNFKGIFEKYKKGTATQSEIEYVENEIEKNELINEYLAEKSFNEFENFLDMKDEEQITQSEVINIKKKMNKKFRKIIFISIAGALAVVIGLNLVRFVALPIYDKSFYNPIGIGNESVDDFFVDMSVFTELHFPEYTTFLGTSAERLGLGKYNLKVEQLNVFQNRYNQSEVKYIREEMENGFKYAEYFPMANSFYDKGNRTVGYSEPFSDEIKFNQSESDFNYYVDEIKKLPNTANVLAYISFKNDLNLDELEIFGNKYELNNFWTAVRIRPFDLNKPETLRGGGSEIGFNPQGVGILIDEGRVDKDNYPYFEIGNVSNNDITTEIQEMHFKSLLKYMIDREKFVETIMPINDISTIYYEQALEYIENNGVKTYGILISASSQEMLKIIEDENFNSIYVSDVKISNLAK